MNNANIIPCEQLYNCNDPKYNENDRQFQGCATIAATKGGRLFAGWYCGGWCEPSLDSYLILIYSDDLGKTWIKTPVLIIPSSKEHLIQALDIQLWVSPEGKLHVFWTQDNVELPKDNNWGNYVDGYLFNDKTHASWVTICDAPDAEELVFGTPRCIDKGFLRCKPLALESGRWINCNYSRDSYTYEYSISDDKGKTYRHMEGAKRVFPTQWDEPMAYQRKDGSIRLFVRTIIGEIVECTSYDDGETWTEAKRTGIINPNARFFVSRTPSGNVILVNNDDRHGRNRMTVFLSEDDGETWKYKKCVDPRKGVSYPDVAFYDGRIYLLYDHDRVIDREMLFISFTEEDIKNPDCVLTPQIISKPTCPPADVYLK